MPVGMRNTVHSILQHVRICVFMRMQWATWWAETYGGVKTTPSEEKLPACNPDASRSSHGVGDWVSLLSEW